MSEKKSLFVLAGDGIGPEVMTEVYRLIEWLERRRDISFEVSEGLVGGAAIEAEGAPISDETMKKALASDAVLLGAVGGPKWDDLPFEQKPERGLLRLRKEMKLFANLRPAVVFPSLAEASTLKPEVVSGLDIMIVRELTGESISAPPAASRRSRTASGAASIPRSTPPVKSSVSRGLLSSWLKSARAACARPTRPMSWKAVSCGVRKCSAFTTRLLPMWS